MRSYFSVRVLNCLEEKNMSQERLAERLNYSTAAVSSWISGKREPKISVLLRMSDIFGCTTDYLLGKTDQPA